MEGRNGRPQTLVCLFEHPQGDHGRLNSTEPAAGRVSAPYSYCQQLEVDFCGCDRPAGHKKSKWPERFYWQYCLGGGTRGCHSLSRLVVGELDYLHVDMPLFYDFD